MPLAVQPHNTLASPFWMLIFCSSRVNVSDMISTVKHQSLKQKRGSSAGVGCFPNLGGTNILHPNGCSIAHRYKINQVYVSCQWLVVIDDRQYWSQTIQEMICWRLCQKSADIQGALDWSWDRKFQLCVIYAWALLSGLFWLSAAVERSEVIR